MARKRPPLNDALGYRRLEAARIVATLDTLCRRITERFPESSLAHLGRETYGVAQHTHENITRLQRPRLGIRIASVLLLLVLIGIASIALLNLRLPAGVKDLAALAQAVAAVIDDVVFVGIAVVFLVSVEARLRRREALKGLHELRSIAHIVDMHQLTKDPEHLLGQAERTPSSPERTMSRGQLSRYLDYCSELLSLTSKLAALYGQHVDDPVVLGAVNEVEVLATGLSNKIWQKIMILDTLKS